MPRRPVTRRTVLLGAGGLASIGLIGPSRWSPSPITVRIWLSERAAAHDGVETIAAGYIRQAFEVAGREVRVRFGETTVPLASDDDERSRRVIWPRMVLEGAIGIGPVRSVEDVNLLITDGDPTGRTAGYAFPHVAAIAGARHLAEMTPVDRTPPTVRYSGPAAIAQLVLHESGHALGLGHDHGVVDVEESTATASPMISAYAWASDAVRRDQLDGPANVCQVPHLPVADHQHRRLSMRYSDCAAAAIRGYRGGGKTT